MGLTFCRSVCSCFSITSSWYTLPVRSKGDSSLERQGMGSVLTPHTSEKCSYSKIGRDLGYRPSVLTFLKAQGCKGPMSSSAGKTEAVPSCPWSQAACACRLRKHKARPWLGGSCPEIRMCPARGGMCVILGRTFAVYSRLSLYVVSIAD